MRSKEGRELAKRGAVGLPISIREADDVFILDLRGKSTIDSGESELMGLGPLRDRLGRASGWRPEGLRPSGPVLEVFRVRRLQEAISSFEDEAQALASFRSQGFAASSS